MTQMTGQFKHREQTPTEKAEQIKSFCRAAKNGDLEYLKTVIASGIDVNSKMVRVSNASYFLLTPKPFLTQDGDSALHNAAYEGRGEACKLLLSAGADINLMNNVRVIVEGVVRWIERAHSEWQHTHNERGLRRTRQCLPAALRS